MQSTFLRFDADVLDATHRLRKHPGSEQFRQHGAYRIYEAKGTWGAVGTRVIVPMKHIKSGGYTVQNGKSTFYYKLPKPTLAPHLIGKLPRGGSVPRVVGTELAQDDGPPHGDMARNVENYAGYANFVGLRDADNNDQFRRRAGWYPQTEAPETRPAVTYNNAYYNQFTQNTPTTNTQQQNIYNSTAVTNTQNNTSMTQTMIQQNQINQLSGTEIDDGQIPNYENVMVSQPGQQTGEGPSIELMPTILEQPVGGSVQTANVDSQLVAKQESKKKRKQPVAKKDPANKKLKSDVQKGTKRSADIQVAAQATFDSRSPRKKSKKNV